MNKLSTSHSIRMWDILSARNIFNSLNCVSLIWRILGGRLILLFWSLITVLSQTFILCSCYTHRGWRFYNLWEGWKWCPALSYPTWRFVQSILMHIFDHAAYCACQNPEIYTYSLKYWWGNNFVALGDF